MIPLWHSCAAISIQVTLSPSYAITVARTRTVDTISALRITGTRDPPTPAHAGSATQARTHGQAGTLTTRCNAADR